MTSQTWASDTWPADDLEVLDACPVCGHGDSRVAFEGVTDKTFRVAPGTWTLRACDGCDTLFLNPRPSEASIGRAYEGYYTHSDINWSARPSQGRNARSLIRNTYLNQAYGYRFPFALPGALAHLVADRATRIKADFHVRHLPAPAQPGLRLLDMGCGNGDFVAIARDLGFDAVGLELDPVASEIGRAAGLDIVTGLQPRDAASRGPFDHVLFSHVLEHLHDPAKALRETFDLLRPGGRVWISQPNPASLGLARFGADWRGLETPRHLTLMMARTLQGLLEATGFERVRQPPPNAVANFFYRHSQAMALGLDPYAPGDPPDWRALSREADAADRRARIQPELGEIVTLMAFKPG